MATQHELTKAPDRSQNGAVGDGKPGVLLGVEGLSVAYGDQQVVDNVSFALGRGESLALIGESGSGKTTIARTVLRLLPKGAHDPRRRGQLRRQEHRPHLRPRVPRAAWRPDGLRPSGPGQRAQSRPEDRRPGARDRPGAEAEEPGGGAAADPRDVRGGRTVGPGTDLPLLSVRAVRRDAAAGADRAGGDAASVVDRRRRTDLGTRCDDPEGRARPVRATQELARAQPAVHHPRPGDRRRARRPPGGAQGRRRTGARVVQDRVREP